MSCDVQVTVSPNQCNIVQVATPGPQGPPGPNASVATIVASLPAPTLGSRYMVIDATSSTFASIVAGGGTIVVPVYADGVNWRVG